MWKVHWQTSTGKVRTDNQDYWVSQRLASAVGPVTLCGVADGVGGHQAGDVASRAAITELVSKLKELTLGAELLSALQTAFIAANDRVYRVSLERAECAGMGTTLTAALITGNRLYLCHVGDSRAYKQSHMGLVRLTEDHSLVGELLRQGGLSDAEAERHPQRHFLTRAVGIGPQLDFDCRELEIGTDEALLFCTDGLTDLVSDRELSEALHGAFNPEDVVRGLVQVAMERGAPDNVTVVLVVWEGGAE